MLISVEVVASKANEKVSQCSTTALQVNANQERENLGTSVMWSCEYCSVVSGIIGAPAGKNCLWDCSDTSDRFWGTVLF